MTIRSRIFPNDEELGKRDDDLKPKAQANGWLPKSSKSPLLRKRRILGFIVACFCIWLFIHNIPQSALGEGRMQRHGAGRARAEHREPPDNGEDLWRQAQQAQDDDVPVSATSSKEREEDINNARDYDGPIRFYYLASSLHAAAKVSGQRASNKNVLFAAADLKSLADLVPMACEMARWRRNNVHVAVMGRDAMPLDEIKRVNAADNESTCPVFWHDARPDFARKSASHRMEVSVAGALGHIENFMHPQAVITNYPDLEEDFFLHAVSRKTKELAQTHIELPKGASENLSWMSRLDARALHSWHTATIEIVVQAPQDSSSNVVRLLKSLERADYGGFLPPRLTVELPHKLNNDIMLFLDEFQWPPSRYQNHIPYHELVLHRRIPDRRLADWEASTRFMESFYPYDTMNSHILVLSPQAELSPTFFHYLKYQMLEYRYSGIADDLFGISLETPSSHLNGSESFLPPQQKTKKFADDEPSATSPFIWQAPNTGAALIFADKWIELHSFLTQFFIASEHPKTKTYFEKRQKQVSEKLPSWTEYLLDLMKARGYYFLYPGAVSENSGGTSLAVLHNDMFQIPEEYLKSREKEDSDPNSLPAGDVLEGSDDAYLSNHHISAEKDALKVERPLLRNLLAVLPAVPTSVSKASQDDEELPEPVPPLDSLPMLDHQGRETSMDNLEDRSADFANNYRQRAGGCTETESMDAEVVHGNAEDLFCIGEHEATADAKTKKPVSQDEAKADRAPSRKLGTEDEAKADKVPVRKQAAKDEAKAEKAAAPKPVGKGEEGVERASYPRTKSVEHTAEVEQEIETATKPQFRATGAATTVNAAVDPEAYAATAVAGFKDKLSKNKHYEDDIPVINIEDHALTNEERRELNSLQARVKGSGKNGKQDAKADAESDPETDAKGASNAEGTKPSRSRADDEKDAEQAHNMEPVIDEREYERTDEYAPEKPQPKETTVDRPTAVGARPDSTDVPGNAESAPEPAQRPQGAADAKGQREKSNMPAEAQDAAIGARGGKTAKKGRIGGWDIGGYDEAIIDEKAAAAGKLDYARNKGRKNEDKVKNDGGGG